MASDMNNNLIEAMLFMMLAVCFAIYARLFSDMVVWGVGVLSWMGAIYSMYKTLGGKK